MATLALSADDCEYVAMVLRQRVDEIEAGDPMTEAVTESDAREAERCRSIATYLEARAANDRQPAQPRRAPDRGEA